MKINCSIEKTRDMFAITEGLMKKAGIPLRDTWDGYDGKNYDNLISNNYKIDGPKKFDVRIVRDGVPRIVTDSYTLQGFKSQAYENVSLLIPVRRAEDIHPIIHELVHFLQHTTEASDKNYINLKDQTVESFLKYAGQRVEQEAFFVQLLYIMEFAEHLVEKKHLAEMKRVMSTALIDVNARTAVIVFAKSIGVI